MSGMTSGSGSCEASGCLLLAGSEEDESFLHENSEPESAALLTFVLHFFSNSRAPRVADRHI